MSRIIVFCKDLVGYTELSWRVSLLNSYQIQAKSSRSILIFSHGFVKPRHKSLITIVNFRQIRFQSFWNWFVLTPDSHVCPFFSLFLSHFSSGIERSQQYWTDKYWMLSIHVYLFCWYLFSIDLLCILWKRKWNHLQVVLSHLIRTGSNVLEMGNIGCIGGKRDVYMRK